MYEWPCLNVLLKALEVKKKKKNNWHLCKMILFFFLLEFASVKNTLIYKQLNCLWLQLYFKIIKKHLLNKYSFCLCA